MIKPGITSLKVGSFKSPLNFDSDVYTLCNRWSLEHERKLAWNEVTTDIFFLTPELVIFRNICYIYFNVFSLGT